MEFVFCCLIFVFCILCFSPLLFIRDQNFIKFSDKISNRGFNQVNCGSIEKIGVLNFLLSIYEGSRKNIIQIGEGEYIIM